MVRMSTTQSGVLCCSFTPLNKKPKLVILMVKNKPDLWEEAGRKVLKTARDVGTQTKKVAKKIDKAARKAASKSPAAMSALDSAEEAITVVGGDVADVAVAVAPAAAQTTDEVFDSVSATTNDIGDEISDVGQEITTTTKKALGMFTPGFGTLAVVGGVAGVGLLAFLMKK